MAIERAWKDKHGQAETWNVIDEDRAARDLANAHGNDAVSKLKTEKALETRFGFYRITD